MTTASKRETTLAEMLREVLIELEMRIDEGDVENESEQDAIAVCQRANELLRSYDHKRNQ